MVLLSSSFSCEPRVSKVLSLGVQHQATLDSQESVTSVHPVFASPLVPQYDEQLHWTTGASSDCNTYPISSANPYRKHSLPLDGVVVCSFHLLAQGVKCPFASPLCFQCNEQIHWPMQRHRGHLSLQCQYLSYLQRCPLQKILLATRWCC